jgi:hypothetical protein
MLTVNRLKVVRRMEMRVESELKGGDDERIAMKPGVGDI